MKKILLISVVLSSLVFAVEETPNGHSKEVTKLTCNNGSAGFEVTISDSRINKEMYFNSCTMDTTKPEPIARSIVDTGVVVDVPKGYSSSYMLAEFLPNYWDDESNENIEYTVTNDNVTFDKDGGLLNFNNLEGNIDDNFEVLRKDKSTGEETVYKMNIYSFNL